MLMTLDASRMMALAMTAPQPSSNALPMTLALVPGGPEAITKGLGRRKPSTTVLKFDMTGPSGSVTWLGGESSFQSTFPGPREQGDSRRPSALHKKRQN